MSTRRWALNSGLAAGTLVWTRLAAAKSTWPNDEIRVAGIGVGGRFRHLQRSFAKLSGLRFVAACDVRQDNLAAAQRLAEPGSQTTVEFRELLDRKDIDAVVIATPDHWHVPIAVAALDAGKHVYVEKPLTHRLEEGQHILAAEARAKKALQVGMQQRSMPHIQKAFEIVRSGRLGKVHKARLTWNRNAPRGMSRKVDYDPKTVDWKRFLGSARPQPFDAFKMKEWRWHWDFGGGIFTDLMVHFLDVVNWCLDLNLPASARSIGDNFQTKGVWETPDTVQTLLQYPDRQVQVHFEGTFVNARQAAMAELMGTDATLYIDRGRYEVHPERGIGNYQELVLGKGKRGADFYESPDGELLHLENWVNAIKTGQPTRCPAATGVRAAAAAHIANAALGVR